MILLHMVTLASCMQLLKSAVE